MSSIDVGERGLHPEEPERSSECPLVGDRDAVRARTDTEWEPEGRKPPIYGVAKELSHDISSGWMRSTVVMPPVSTPLHSAPARSTLYMAGRDSERVGARTDHGASRPRRIWSWCSAVGWASPYSSCHLHHWYGGVCG